MINLGVKKNLSRLFTDGKTIIIPVDDWTIGIPDWGVENINSKLSAIAESKPNAVLGFLKECAFMTEKHIPFIYNLTWSSSITGNHIRKINIASPEQLAFYGVECAAIHVNFTCKYQNEQLSTLEEYTYRCHQLGIAVLAIMYPRTTKDGKDYNYLDLKEKNNEAYTSLVCQAVNVANQYGVDIIKCNYTGNIESFKKVIDIASSTPIVIAGGPMISIIDSYKMAREAIKAGGSGISYGRNVFNQEHIVPYVEGLKNIVFNGSNEEEALKIYKKTLERRS
jgi:fructose-bisphosphate aldolase/2-amino-3,7-dideoxy-D-threo-hept-6-ulosonate synthase